MTQRRAHDCHDDAERREVEASASCSVLKCFVSIDKRLPLRYQPVRSRAPEVRFSAHVEAVGRAQPSSIPERELRA